MQNKLYHGTSESAAIKAIKKGLQPRGKRKGNWDKCPSNPESIYLTDVYGPYFAISALERAGGRMAIVEINITPDVRTKFMPDEDYVEQATRGMPEYQEKLKGMSMVERTNHFIKSAREMSDTWEHSLTNLGTLAHDGLVDPKNISSVALIDVQKQRWLRDYAGFANITIKAHRFMAPKYRNLTRWIFGESISVGEWLQRDEAQVDSGESSHVEQLLTNRDGIEIIRAEAEV